MMPSIVGGRECYNLVYFGVNILVQKTFQFFFLMFIIVALVVGCKSAGVEVENAVSTVMIATKTSVTIDDDLAKSTNVLTATFTPTIGRTDSPTPEPYTTLIFTGVIVPARCVQAGVEEKGQADYIYDEVREILIAGDITVGVFNATMSDKTEKIGCFSSWELVGTPNNADALANAGFDLMSVATNHIKDCGKKYCGDQAFFDTLENMDRVGIQYVGAGENIDAAIKPVVISANGLRFGFVSLGEVNERVYADASTPGIGVLSLKNLDAAITTVKEVADVVVFMPHSGPEDWPEVTPQQYYWARNAVAAGADLVVMNHAHIIQGVQMIDDVPVFYSLGNFVFDQIWSRDHQQSVILKVIFYEDEIVGYEFVPTVVEQDGTVLLAIGDEKDEILERIDTLSEALSN